MRHCNTRNPSVQCAFPGPLLFAYRIHSLRMVDPNGHGKYAALNNETRDARFPLPSPPPLGEENNVSLRELHVNESARLNPRTSAEAKAMIERAATLMGTTVSSFMLQNAFEAARRIVSATPSAHRHVVRHLQLETAVPPHPAFLHLQLIARGHLRHPHPLGRYCLQRYVHFGC